MFIPRPKADTKVTILAVSVPSIHIGCEALTKMQIYVEECSDEIGWLGTAYKSDNHIVINDVFLFDQEVHSTTTEITPDGLASFGENILSQENGMDIWNNLKVWGHSHVNMGVIPSGQDDSQMEAFRNTGHDWFIRIIANKKGELKVDLYNFETACIYTDVKWYAMELPEEAAIVDQIIAIEKETEEQIKFLEGQIKGIKEAAKSSLLTDIKPEMAIKVRKKSYVTTYRKGRYDQQLKRWVYEDEEKKTSESTTQISMIGDTNNTSTNTDIGSTAANIIKFPIRNESKSQSLPIGNDTAIDEWLLTNFKDEQVYEMALCRNMRDLDDTLWTDHNFNLDMISVQYLQQHLEDNFSQIYDNYVMGSGGNVSY